MPEQERQEEQGEKQEGTKVVEAVARGPKAGEARG